MASHSPQRTRRSQPLQPSQGPIHAMQARETSRSPSLRDRPRTLKAQSMPMVPSVNQIFAANGAVSPSAQQQQPSPTIASGTIPPRNLPVPPDQVPLPSPEPRSSPPSNQTYPGPQSGVNPHFPRPIRGPPSFLRHFTDAEVDDLKITEVMADIERADLQTQPSSNTYPSSYGPGLRSDTPSQKDPIERVRAMERASPSNLDLQSRRQREPARESPKARDRQPTSPSNTGFIQQNQQSGAPTPERRLSPKPSHIATNDQQAQHSQNVLYGRDYATRDSPGVPRRAGNIGTDPRSNLSYNQTPPLQSSVARPPDRTLPLQEEAEDEFGPSSKGPWKETGLGALDRISSPTPSSDLNPDGNSQRYDRHNGRGDTLNGRGIEENVSLAPQSKASDSTNRYSDKDGEDSGSYTPRSPTANLPDHRSHDKYYQPPTQRTSPKVSSRVKSRNGSIDGLGLRTIDPSAFESNGPSSAAPPTTTSERSSYIDHRQQQDSQYAPPKQAYQPQTQAQAPNPNPNPSYSTWSQGPAPRSPQASHRTFSERQPPPPPASVPPQPNYPKNGYYDQAQVYPDDFQTYSEDPASFSYLHAYLASPRPDAPIPPTPHSQSAAPSPSPFPNGYGGKPMPGYSPIAPVGSPYPYPFTHVRRNPPAPTGFSQYSSTYDPNHPAAIQEQLAKQWQIYLQNQVNGNMTDSTFSPAATPFQGANYNPYAFLHTARLTRQQRDTMSLHSSPSHEPIPLPVRTGRKKDLSKDLRHQMASRRRPPPRVDSTQPRDTSPEPSSSGEETAGEYPPTTSSTQPTSRESSMTNGERGGKTLSPLNGGELWKTASTSSSTAGERGGGKDEVDEAQDDEDEDWIDEDEEADDSDLLDFEYHPNYVPNTDKRRRRWEVGWEALVQSFQKLDRQTDTTMIVLAAPPHSNKLYSIRSRSIRRAPVLRNSAAMRDVRSNFKRLATQRKNIRPVKPQSLADKLLESSSATGDGSDGSNESRAEDLRKALEMALGSLNVLNGMYERRESRWQEEMKKMQHDKEQVSFYLNQVLGMASSQQPASAPAYPQPLPPFPMAMTMPGAAGPPYSAFPPLPSSSLPMIQQPVPSIKEPTSAKTM